jgi:hypothetical protein
MECYLDTKKNEIILLADKCIELNIIVLSELIEALNGKGHVSIMRKLDLKDKYIHKYIYDLYTHIHMFVLQRTEGEHYCNSVFS